MGKPPVKEPWQIAKRDGPAPGSYDTTTAINKTQFRSIVATPKRQEKLVSFVDAYKKRFGDQPGPAHYKNMDNHSKVLHKDKNYAKAVGHMT